MFSTDFGPIRPERKGEKKVGRPGVEPSYLLVRNEHLRRLWFV